MRIPNLLMPPLMNNHGNYIVSLGNLCRWLGEQAAEALGVEIYPGFAGGRSALRRGRRGRGVATGDMGIGRDGKPTDNFTPRHGAARQIHASSPRARAARWPSSSSRSSSCDDGREPQKFGIGLKELWQVAPEKHQPGLVQHTLGWPLDDRTGGGSFLYHFGDDHVAVGFVVHLNYENPYLSPFEEFQRFKTHPAIRRRSRAASASPTARARSPRAAGSRCRSSSSPAAR